MNGLVLTGGQSRRMGRDKAELSFHDLPQWRYLGDLLEEICDEVFWSCTAQQRADWFLGDSGLVDRHPGIGPAAGILTAFEHDPTATWVIVACDFPNIRQATLRHLIENHRENCDATAFRSPGDGLPEPLLAIWEPAALQRLKSGVQNGDTSPRHALFAGSVTLIGATDPDWLQNVNTAEDLERYGLGRTF